MPTFRSEESPERARDSKHRISGPARIGQSAAFTAPEPEGLYSTDPQLNYLPYSWSDGGARDHTIRTPTDSNTYMAVFRRLRR